MGNSLASTSLVEHLTGEEDDVSLHKVRVFCDFVDDEFLTFSKMCLFSVRVQDPRVRPREVVVVRARPREHCHLPAEDGPDVSDW